ncbi:MAG: M20/M25/M40 family metallo-hydrolase [Lachnospiraceae bacterium]|nr:M20/M25/M40 family metallo-hydrolase [Lachnospiraceae bacterium]
MRQEEAVRKISEKAEAYLESQVTLLTRFAEFDSETHYLEGNRKAVDLAKEYLADLDPEFEEITFEQVGTHLLARIRPENPKGRIILNAHLDTVFPVGFAAENQPRVEGDWLYGLGVIDCKGGVAVSCFALKILKELGLLPDVEIDILYTCDEEQGSMTGQDVFARIAPGADAAFIFEPGDYKEAAPVPVLTSRQGVILGNLDITGVEAHAGCDYSKGRSANLELAHKILELYSFNDDEKGIYYNAAPVSGGRPNGVVSGSANMQFCVAGIPDWESYHQCEEKLDQLGSHSNNPDIQLELSYRMLFPPQLRLEKTGEIYDMVEQAAELLGVQVEEAGVNPNGEDLFAATDANYFASHGIPALDGFGVMGVGMHTTEERVHIPSIKTKTELFAVYLYLLGQSL